MIDKAEKPATPANGEQSTKDLWDALKAAGFVPAGKLSWAPLPGSGHLRFDAALDHRAPGLAERLAEACPDALAVHCHAQRRDLRKDTHSVVKRD